MKLQITRFILVLLCLGTVARAADDPFLGTWKMNLAKSKSEGPPGPTKPTTNRMEMRPNGEMKNTVLGFDEKGNETREERIIQFDGKDHAVTGNSNWGTLAIKKIDARTWQEVYKKSGTVVRMGRRAVSADGKTMNLTVVGANPAGLFSSAEILYDKQ